jgi:hypothetical protein
MDLSSQQQAVDAVCTRIELLRSRAGGATYSFKDMPQLQSDPEALDSWPGLTHHKESSVVAILGGRGSGKTTVMESVLRRLLKNRNGTTVVLDPIIPEEFLLGDHPMGWIAASLSAHVSQLRRGLEDKGLQELSRQLLEHFSLFNDRVNHFLLANGTDLQSYDDSVVRKTDLRIAASTSGHEVPSAFARFLETLFRVRRQLHDSTEDGADLLVVCFDDVDLHPELAARLLHALPMVLVHPGVVVILAADPELLRADVRRLCSKWAPDAAADTIEQLAEDHLRKRIPHDSRVFLPPLATSQRLAFISNTSEQSLLEVMASIQIRSSSVGPRTLADIFTLQWNGGERGKPDQDLLQTMYPGMLPKDFRSLTQLHGLMSMHARSLEQICRDTKDPIRSPEYMGEFFVLLKGILRVCASAEADAVGPLADVIAFDDQAKRITIENRVFAFGTRTSSIAAFESGHGIYWTTDYFANKSQDDKFGSSVSRLLMFQAETILMPVVRDERRRIPTPGGIEQGILRDSDGRLNWPIPSFDSFVIHQALNRRWRLSTSRWVDELEKYGHRLSGRDATVARLKLLYWYQSAIIEAVCCPGRDIRHLRDERTVFSERTWRQAASRAAQVMRTVRTEGDRGDRLSESVFADLRRWVLVQLAWLSLPDVVEDPEVNRRVVDLRSAIAQAVGFSEEELGKGEGDAKTDLAEQKRDFPKIRLEDVDLNKLVMGLLQGDETSIATANYLVAMDRTPTEKRAQLVALLRQLGQKVPDLTGGDSVESDRQSPS